MVGLFILSKNYHYFVLKNLILLLLLTLSISTLIAAEELQRAEVPSKVLKKFSKDHKSVTQQKFYATDLGNVKITFFNTEMRESWAYYTPEGVLLKDVVKVPLSELPGSIIPQIMKLQREIDTRYQKETTINPQAKIIGHQSGQPRYVVEITDALKTASMEFTLDGKYTGTVLDDQVY